MCRYLTDDEFEVIHDALRSSVELDTYDDTLEMLKKQDEAYRLMQAARER